MLKKVCLPLICTNLILLVVIYFEPLKHYFLLKNSDIEKCPFCYGQNICNDFKNSQITLSLNKLQDFLNLIGTKNVYNANFNDKNVIIKKLAHNSELDDFDNTIKDITKNDVSSFIYSKNLYKSFIVCDKITSDIFLSELYDLNYTKENIWTLLNINIEPLLLDIFLKNQNWPTPKLYGYCGRYAVVENCGENLNNFEHTSWLDRAFLALQLLQAAFNFTSRHEHFRLYLTDLSPDNIVVNKDFKISFIDLEHAIIGSNTNAKSVHYSVNFKDQYAFSQTDICSKSISDHNIYSVCKLFLSKFAPWPMMKNGLLHSPPISIITKYKKLDLNIKFCVSSANRFYFAKNIVNILDEILYNNKYKFLLKYK